MNRTPTRPGPLSCREGIFAAVWTPTDAGGSLLEADLKANLRFLARKKVRGFMALGSTGDFLHLEMDQRKRVLELVVNGADSRPVIANISDIRPRIVAELGRFARQIGASAVAVMTPFFYPLAQADLVEFFVRAGQAAQLPLFLYNFPERTGNRIALETIARVAERVPVAGVKQSGAEFAYHRALANLGRERNFLVLTGSDARLAEAMALGATGCISGLANAVPDLLVRIFESVKGGAPQRAAKAIERVSVIGTLVERLEFPLNIAAIMEARGLPVGHPKSLVSPSTQARSRELTAACEKSFRAWKLI